MLAADGHEVDLIATIPDDTAIDEMDACVNRYNGFIEKPDNRLTTFEYCTTCGKGTCDNRKGKIRSMSNEMEKHYDCPHADDAGSNYFHSSEYLNHELGVTSERDVVSNNMM